MPRFFDSNFQLIFETVWLLLLFRVALIAFDILLCVFRRKKADFIISLGVYVFFLFSVRSSCENLRFTIFSFIFRKVLFKLRIFRSLSSLANFFLQHRRVASILNENPLAIRRMTKKHSMWCILHICQRARRKNSSHDFINCISNESAMTVAVCKIENQLCAIQQKANTSRSLTDIFCCSH